MIVATPRRIRFDEEGEEARIPVVALAYTPVHAPALPLDQSPRTPRQL